MKKIQIIRDAKRQILGTSEVFDGDSAVVVPFPERDEEVLELEVSDDFTFEQSRKIQMVKDSKGKVLATFEQSDETTKVSVSSESEKVQYEEVNESSGYYLLDLDAFYKRYSKS
jgi:hypothetical protein